MRRLLLWVSALALLPMSAFPGAEGSSPLFDFYDLQFRGKGLDHILVYMNGDGLLDLGLLFTTREAPESFFLRTCLQSKRAGFDTSCGRADFPPEARAFDIGEIDDRPGAHLVIMTDRGIRNASFTEGGFGAFDAWPGVRTLLDGTAPETPKRMRFLWDLDGDGRKELVLPGLEGLALYRFEESGPLLLQTLHVPAEISYEVGGGRSWLVNRAFRTYLGRARARFTSPDVFVEDFDGDDRLDLVTLTGNRLRVFFQGEAGGFQSKPALEVERSSLTPEEREDEIAGEVLTFADLNGDGLRDLILVKWGSPEQRTRIDRSLYFARPGLVYPDEPDQIIRSESAFPEFTVSDLDRDGRLDFVIPFFHLAISQAFRVMTDNALKVQFRIFLMRPDGRYAQDPGKTFTKVDRRVVLDYRIDVLGLLFDDRRLPAGQFNPVISFQSDVNGDGYPDLVADTGADRLAFYWGNENARYGRSPDHVVDFESALDFEVEDMNGDGKADIVTFHAHKERTQRDVALRRREQQMKPGQRKRPQPVLTPRPEGPGVKLLISR